MSLTPYPQNLSPADAAHFLRRTAYGATDAQIHARYFQELHPLVVPRKLLQQ